jgi:chromosome segregation protein
VLGERLGGILIDRAEVGLEAIELLKRNAAGRSTFLVIDPSGGDEADAEVSVPGDRVVIGRAVDLVRPEPGYGELVELLLGDVIVVADLAQAVELHQAGVGGPIVTLEGDLIDRDGVLAGGSPEAASGVLAQKREIRELEGECGELETELASATARLVSSKSELQRVTKTLASLKTESHDGDLAITAQEKDLIGSRGELDRLRNQRARLNSEQLELEELTGAANAERARLASVEAEAADRIAHHGAAVETLGASLESLRRAADDASAAVTEAKVRVAQLGEKRASVEASAARLEGERRELSDRIGRLEERINQDTTRAAELISGAEEIEAELAGVRGRRRALAESLSEGRGSYDARQAAVGEAEVAVRKRRSETESLSSEVTALEMKLTNVELEKRHLENSIDERYHLPLASVLGDYHLRPPVTSEDTERLAQRRKLIERMGSDINLTAIDEYTQISERHEFLSSQQIDLESAVGQLERAISKINKVSRRLFKETFDAVNAEFSAVFPRLFRGGRAKLALTPHKGAEGNQIDVLEAGVEIMAQPPGKKNTTVDQLSGGEKALTAVALLFAIFLIKPSPFCLLDEVDAPLDDANVDRYNAMLREMTDRSQFIVITHNKRTMEITDRLYGVTMQEPGVSKLVTVNLTRIGDGDGDGDVVAA